MKKIITCLFLSIFLGINATAFSADVNSLKFHGKQYFLKYSAKNSDSNGYLNEYYLQSEIPEKWSELVAIHHFPNSYSPIDQIESFQELLTSMNCPYKSYIDENENYGIIDFIMFNKVQNGILIEYDIFKYEKHKICGTVAIQYSRRYFATNQLYTELIQEDILKNRKKMIKWIGKFNIPKVIQEAFEIETPERKSTEVSEQKSIEKEVIDNENKEPVEQELGADVKEESNANKNNLDESSENNNCKTEVEKVIENIEDNKIQNSDETINTQETPLLTNDNSETSFEESKSDTVLNEEDDCKTILDEIINNLNIENEVVENIEKVEDSQAITDEQNLKLEIVNENQEYETKIDKIIDNVELREEVSKQEEIIIVEETDNKTKIDEIIDEIQINTLPNILDSVENADDEKFMTFIDQIIENIKLEQTEKL